MAKPVCRYPSQVNRINNYPKTASVDAAVGDWITITSGYAKRATSTSPNLLGISRKAWTNDATNDYVPVEEDEFGLFEMDADATLVQATHVGNAYDLNDQDELDLGGTTIKVLTVLGITPEGRALVRINRPFSRIAIS